MDKLGGWLGLFTGLLVFLALLNYLMKWINRRWVMKLPNQSKFKAVYTPVMRFLVRNHRFFGLGAALLLVIHLVLQIIFRWVSPTGLIALTVLLIDVGMGTWLYYKLKGKQPSLLMVHRVTAVVLITAIAEHLITRL